MKLLIIIIENRKDKQLKDLQPIDTGESELFKAVKLISKTGEGPKEQHPSMGCNIKWIK